MEAAAWFAVALAILAWPRPAYGAPGHPAHVKPVAGWRRLFSSGLGLASHQEAAVIAKLEPGRGRDAEHPSQIPPLGWKDILVRTLREFIDDRGPAVAGGVAFFSLLAVFPAMVAFVSLYGLFADVELAREQLNLLVGVLPPESLAFVGEHMLRIAGTRESSLGLTFALSVVLSLWSSNIGMKHLFDGLNVAYEEKEKRGFIRLNLTALTFTVGGIAFLILVVAAVIALPIGLSLLGYEGRDPMWMLRWPLLLAIVVLALAVLYRFGPSRARARWRWVSWGSVAAAFLWLAASMGYSWYVANFGNFDRTYGSLGAVVGFMFWMWISIIVVILGAQLNAEIEHQTAVDSTTGQPKPMGFRHAKMADTLGKTSDRIAREPHKPTDSPLTKEKLGAQR